MAYADGFEVVVFDTTNSVATNVRSLRLRDAEDAIAAGAQAFVVGDPSLIERKIPTGKSGDSHVVFNVQPLGNKQQIRLEFHYSLRTFTYEYLVEGQRLQPLESGYRDLARSSTVTYASK